MQYINFYLPVALCALGNINYIVVVANIDQHDQYNCAILYSNQ